MDVKSTYLQVKGFQRDMYVQPPREEDDSEILWNF